MLGFLAAGSRRDMAERIAADLHVLLAQYMRALVLLGVVASLAYGLFFSIIGVPYGILLAAVAFPLEFIPMVGPLAGATIVLLVAGLSGSHHLLAIFVFLLAFRFFQDYVVSPHLLSAGMKLHPLLVIFGVLAGGSIAGVAGSFLSVPVLATLRIVYRQLLTKTPPTVVAPDGAAPLGIPSTSLLIGISSSELINRALALHRDFRGADVKVSADFGAPDFVRPANRVGGSKRG